MSLYPLTVQWALRLKLLSTWQPPNESIQYSSGKSITNTPPLVWLGILLRVTEKLYVETYRERGWEVEIPSSCRTLGGSDSTTPGIWQDQTKVLLLEKTKKVKLLVGDRELRLGFVIPNTDSRVSAGCAWELKPDTTSMRW